MEIGKNELEDFLDENLLCFITDDAPLPSSELFSDSHTHQQNNFVDNLEDTDGMLLEAIEQFEKASQQTSKSDSCNNLALRQFANPVTGEDIQQAMQSRIPENTNKDTKYCAKMWEEWVAS